MAAPVWFVIENGRLLVITDPQSFKAERIRRNAGVMITPCSATGRPRSEPLPARAEFLPQSELGHAKEMRARQYRIDTFLILPLYRAVRRLRGAHEGTAEIVLAITLTAAASGPKFSEDSS
ncbi:MAG: hypothetical protein ACXVH3_37980 [Solirubrobacteraceae bacterium]